MDAMTSLCPYRRKSMTMNTLIDQDRGRRQRSGTVAESLYEYCCPRVPLVFPPQTKPNKGHRTRFLCVAHVKKQTGACKELSDHSTKKTRYIRA
jgi:hypothetical protein